MVEQARRFQLEAQNARLQKDELCEELKEAQQQQCTMTEQLKQHQEVTDSLQDQIRIAYADKQQMAQLLQQAQDEIRTAQEETDTAKQETRIAQESQDQALGEARQAQLEAQSQREQRDELYEQRNELQEQLRTANEERCRMVEQADENAARAQQQARTLEGLVAALKDHCVCPITHQLMNDPVMAADGHSYERDAIERWFSAHRTSPSTNLPLNRHEVIPNILASNVVRALENHSLVGSINQNEEDAASASNVSSGNPQEEAPLGQWDFHSAVLRRDRDAYRAMLARRELPHLNDLYEAGQVLTNPDGSPIQLYWVYTGWTVLHVAAFFGLEDLCCAILARPDFTEAHRITPTHHGLGTYREMTADQIAAKRNYQSLSDMIKRHLRQ